MTQDVLEKNKDYWRVELVDIPIWGKRFAVQNYTKPRGQAWYAKDWCDVAHFATKESAEEWLREKLEEEEKAAAYWEQKIREEKQNEQPKPKTAHWHSDDVLVPWGVGRISSALDERTRATDR